MDEFEHPGHNHPLLRFRNHGAVDIKCHGCMSNVPTGYDFYSCQQDGCEYYLDSSCFRLGRYDSEIDHPLHSQHPLTPHFAKSSIFPNDQKPEFVCSFCGKNRTLSGFVFYCGQCDFYLDPFCFLYFELRQLLLRNYEFPHFLHRRENHILSPHLCTKSTAVCQLGCRKGNISEGDLVFKCTSCDYYLHVNCSQVPQQIKHPFHPHHTLNLVQNDYDFEELRCNACYIRIKELFVLRCTECDFYLDIGCSAREATVKSDHHAHPLVYFGEIYNVDVEDVMCAVCNTLCDGDLLRCVDCNFNIHPGCRSLPFVVEYYDHVHPLTLNSNSFKEVDDSGQYYYCDVCEERRNPHHAVYSCEECPSFVSHFKCVLPPESIVHLKTSLLQELEDNLYLSSQEIERKGEITTTDKAVVQKAIVSELNMEMAKMGGLVKQLLKKVQSVEVTQEIEKIEESHAKAESMVRKLGETFT